MPKVSQTYKIARTEEILGAALICFSRSGYRRASMTEIAKEAGLSVGALYRYFENKEVLFEALSKMAREVNKTYWEEILSAGSPEDQFRKFLDQFFEMARDPKGKASLMLDIRMRNEALDSALVRRELRASYQLQIKGLSKLLMELHGKSISSARVKAMAVSLLGMLNEVGVQVSTDSAFNIGEYRRHMLSMISAWSEKSPG